ncbi:hypothetical protein FQA39_LY19045 [Lamprigera yunnana]|nr:hypothetical protein FQA39_LY19045 [Lamprigera yunnana]
MALAPLKIQRRSVRAQLTRLEDKVTEALNSNDQEKSEVVCEKLRLKKETLQDKDKEIMALLIETTEIEAEIEDRELYEDKVVEWSVMLKRIINDGSTASNASNVGGVINGSIVTQSSVTSMTTQFQNELMIRLTKFDRRKFNGEMKKTVNMAKATSIKEAIKRWEEKNGKSIAEAEDVGFQFQWLPIEKMDNALSALANVRKLSLSTNNIEKIGGLASLKHLKILSLARNSIKTFAGLEPVADTLEELWISYNIIEKVKGVGVLRKLKVLYMSHNLVKEWGQFNLLQVLTSLENLLFIGNPLAENLEENIYKTEVLKRLPTLKRLDGDPILRGGEEEEETEHLR